MQAMDSSKRRVVASVVQVGSRFMSEREEKSERRTNKQRSEGQGSITMRKQ